MKNLIKEYVNKYIKDKKGDISNIGDGIYNILNDNLNLPYYKDGIGGLTIMIHGIWGMNVYLKNYSYISSNKYSGKIVVSIYDHFGLDDDDLDMGILQSIQQDGFSAWYCLQKYEGFYGKYKPFINKFEWEEDLK